MAAHRAGIERIILSAQNKKDLRDVPEEIKMQMKFDFVDTISEVLKLALGLDIESPKTESVAPAPITPGPAPAAA